MELKLKGKNALVIASSQGLGKAIAKGLISEGVNVMLTSRHAEKLKEVKRELDEIGRGSVHYYQADITKKDDILSLVQTTIDSLGSIDILINNAGGPPAGNFSQMSDEDWQNAFELNLLSYIRIIREVLPSMETSGGGRIINIASSSIKQPLQDLILSNTFRLGIVGLTKTLAEELASKNILIHTVAPGRIATDRVVHIDKVKAEKTGHLYEEVVQNAKSAIPLQRYGTPTEFANVVTFLVSDACTYMTGSSLLVDGGMVSAI